jgi:dihydroorotate dehydrogenase electron transfer subunit
MTSPLHASYYADNAVQETVAIVENERLARDTWRCRYASLEMARRVVPGQFVMVRLTDVDDPLIGRPLAVYDVVLSENGQPTYIDLVYLVKGKFTNRLVKCLPGQKMDVWGPLGNGFAENPTEHLVIVAGGIGQTPFLILGKEFLGLQQFGNPQRCGARASKVTMCYGGRTADYLAGVDDFRRIGIEMRIATDDGSLGHHGLVTDVLQKVLDETTLRPGIVCCGPEPMMEAVAKIAAERDVPCQVSLETPMACGIGICFTCVAKVFDEHGDWDYKRTCVEGPVFEAKMIDW